MQELSRQVGTGGQPVRLPAFSEQVHKNQIREIEDHQLFHIRQYLTAYDVIFDRAVAKFDIIE